MTAFPMVASLLGGSAVGLSFYTITQFLQNAAASYEETYSRQASSQLDALDLTITPRQLIILRLLMACLCAFLLFFLYQWVGVLFGFVLGLWLPIAMLKKARQKREKLFIDQLADCLGTMANALRSGMSFQQAMELITREMDDPLAREFGITLNEISLGVPTEQALQNMTQRMPLPDLMLLVNAVTVSLEVGGNLTEVFDHIADTIRERVRVEGRIQALTAQGRAQGVTMTILPCALLAFLSSFYPQYISPMLDNQLGIGMLLFGALWLGLGYVFIQKVVAIDV